MTLKHAFVSSVPDGGDATLVRPSNWNADHVLSSGDTRVLFNDATAIGMDAGFTFNKTTSDLLVTGAFDSGSIRSPLFVCTTAHMSAPGYVLKDALINTTDPFNPTTYGFFSPYALTGGLMLNGSLDVSDVANPPLSLEGTKAIGTPVTVPAIQFIGQRLITGTFSDLGATDVLAAFSNNFNPDRWTLYANGNTAQAGTFQSGVVSSATGAIKLAHASSAFLTTIQAGNAAAARTYTWPTNLGVAGCALIDAAANGTLSWSAALGSAAFTSSAAYAVLGVNTFTAQQTMIAGSAGTPAMTFTGAGTNTGFFSSGSNIVGITIAGTTCFSMGSNEIDLFQATSSPSYLFLANACLLAMGTAGTKNVYLGPSAAAVLQQGAANAASPVAQTLQAQGSRSGTDSNVAGASYTIQSGNGTGNATGSSLIFKAPVAVASGTGAQTQTTALTITGALVDAAVAVNATAYKVGGTAGADFGPGLPTSITVVKGIITAIS